MSSNVTLKLDERLLKRAKKLAVEKDSSLSRLLSAYLKDMVEKATRYGNVRKRAVKKIEKGLDLNFMSGGRRDDLHRF